MEDQNKMIITRINKEDIEPIELKEVIATPENAEYIEKIQKYIKETAQKDKNGKSVFAADDKDFILSIINSQRGLIVLYFNEKDLVGLFELRCPDDPKELEEEYKISNYIPNCDIENIGVAESVLIMPKYRGNGLQVKMFERMEELAKERGITSLIGTVHPDNKYSLDNFERSGYKYITDLNLYYGNRKLEYKEINTLDNTLENNGRTR